MAQATGFLTNKSPYSSSGQDLNTIFEPIVVNEIDYGTFSDTSVGTNWDTIGRANLNTPNNISISGNGFKITSKGLYRLNIALNFGSNNGSSFQNIAFILSNNASLSGTSGYSFTPSPTMANISAINCSGACGVTGNAQNYLNSQNIGNCLSLNPVASNTDTTNPYFFAFRLTGTSSTSNSNFFTLDITFTASLDQFIYPYIRCTGSGQTVFLQNSKWMFTKINDI